MLSGARSQGKHDGRAARRAALGNGNVHVGGSCAPEGIWAPAPEVETTDASHTDLLLAKDISLA